jgi:hypothetical protein
MIDSNPLNHLGSGAKSNGLPAGKWMLKQRSLLVLCAFALLAGSAGRCRAQAAPAPVYNPTNPIPTEAKQLPSVSVAPDHRVTFRIRAPQTNTVTLNGDFLLGPRRHELQWGLFGMRAPPRCSSSNSCNAVSTSFVLAGCPRCR